MAERTIVEIEMRLKKAEDAIRKLKKIEDQGKKTTNAFIKKVGGLAAGAFTVAALGRALSSLVSRAKELDGIQTAFKGVNVSIEELRKSVRGTVDDFTLMKTAVRAEKLIGEGGIAQLPKFLEFASIRAREIGESVDFLVESIVTGIGRKSALIIDNLGISATRVQAEFKKTGDFAQAIANVVEEETPKMDKNISAFADGMDKAAASTQNLWDKVAGVFTSVAEWETSAEEGDTVADGWALTMQYLGFKIDDVTNAIDSNSHANKMAKETYKDVRREGSIAAALKDAEARAAIEAELAYVKWREAQEKKIEKDKDEVKWMQRWIGEAQRRGEIATEMTGAQVTDLQTMDLAQKEILENQKIWLGDTEALAKAFKKVSVAAERAFDAKMVATWSTDIQEGIKQVESAWQQALLNQWNEGQSFFGNILRGFEQMLASLVAMVLSRAAIFGLFQIIGSIAGTGGASGILGKGFWDFINPFSAQHGGRFTVGGQGGLDSQLVALRASPGEEVSVSNTNTMNINIGTMDRRNFGQLMTTMRKIQRGIAI